MAGGVGQALNLVFPGPSKWLAESLSSSLPSVAAAIAKMYHSVSCHSLLDRYTASWWTLRAAVDLEAALEDHRRPGDDRRRPSRSIAALLQRHPSGTRPRHCSRGADDRGHLGNLPRTLPTWRCSRRRRRSSSPRRSRSTYRDLRRTRDEGVANRWPHSAADSPDGIAGSGRANRVRRPRRSRPQRV